MDYGQAIVLALIQGLTEFLPVSSSAHLILPAALLNWPDQGLAFDVAVHAGSLTAVVVHFRRELLQMTRGTLGGAWHRQMNPDFRLALLIVLATVPLVVLGPVLDDAAAGLLRNTLIIAATTIGFGLLLALADHQSTAHRDEYHLTPALALIIGGAQVLAVIPGTSRSGITITAALFLGLTRNSAARFSMLLSIPAILGALVLQVDDLVNDPGAPAAGMVLVGFLGAAGSAWVCIRAFLRLVETIGMLPFVIYRIALGALLATLALAGIGG